MRYPNGKTVNNGISLFRGKRGGADGSRRWVASMVMIAAMAASSGDAREQEIEQRVMQQHGRTWIETMPVREPLGWMGWDSQLRGLQTLLHQRGLQVPFEELAAVSGDAFLIAHNQEWRGVDLHLSSPTDPLRNVGTAYGFNAKVILGGPLWTYKRDKGMPAARETTLAILDTLWHELDAGRSVMAGGVAGECGRWAVVTGYNRSKMEMLYDEDGEPQWRPIAGFNFPSHGEPGGEALGYWDSRVRGAVWSGHPHGSFGGWQVSAAFILGERGKVPTPATRMLSAIKRAVSLHHTSGGKSHIGAEVAFGAAAYQALVGDLNALQDSVVANAPRSGPSPNEMDLRNLELTVEQLVVGRHLAASFCERAAAELPEASEYLKSAAESYRRESELAQDAFGPFSSRVGELTDDHVAWLADPATRQSAARITEQLLLIETTAVASLHEVVATYAK